MSFLHSSSRFGRFLARSYSLRRPFESNLKKRSNENRELVLSILKLTTTRRETRFYLDKYSTFNESTEEFKGPYRLALIKLRGNVQEYDEEELKKFSSTLDYMKRLGASPVILLDPDFLSGKVDFNFTKIDNFIFTQFNHLNRCLSNKSIKLTPVRSLFSVTDEKLSLDPPTQIIHSLTDSHIPVIFPYVFDTAKSKQWIINSTEYLSNLIPELHNIEGVELTVEKMIFIDKLGGIPSIERSNNSHVFINLEQEYDRIQSELNIGHLSIYERGIHSSNVASMKQILTSVNYTDLTGIITTLTIANENLNMNPIIYNILTDRSIVSSSLPTTKYANKEFITNKVSRTSIIKKGLNVLQRRSFKELDMVKFKALIDDSFKRSLDLEHFLTRVEPVLNQIIIVGDYDGIAIITNEKASSGAIIPYLDKFAISRNAQGSLGVADMIFNLLKREYKDNLLWRSKKANPVNGWYFQRSSGSLGLVDSEFRIFWTKPNVRTKDLVDYVEIGKSIVPSWEK
jgi:amino-acid N-acetyltransferase